MDTRSRRQRILNRLQSPCMQQVTPVLVCTLLVMRLLSTIGVLAFPTPGNDVASCVIDTDTQPISALLRGGACTVSTWTGGRAGDPRRR